jgi:hypothetical protein
VTDIPNQPDPAAPSPRAAELIERRLHTTLTDAEEAELAALATADPKVAADLAASEEEHRAMTSLHATPPDLPPFDFARARRVIEHKLKTERRILASFAFYITLTPLFILAISWPTPDWRLMAWCTFLPGTPVVLWAIYRWREAAAFRKAVHAGPDADLPALEEAWQRHIRRGRNEFTIMGAAVALVFLALVVWLIELVDKGAWPIVPFALVGAAVMGYQGVRRMWTRKGREANERELAGLDDDASAN